MIDRRVRQHALHVRLHDGEHGADQHRRHGQRVDVRLPVGLVAVEGDEEHPQQTGEPSGLDGRRHERHDGGRRTLVHVRHPRVERHGGDLEPEPDQQQRQPGEQESRCAGGEELRVDFTG